MPSKTDICNMALGHLKSAPIVALTERSDPARSCALFYAQTRDEVLRAFPWPFATQFVALGVVPTNPSPEWRYAYRYPNDCAQLRRILNGFSRLETSNTRVPYRLGRDSDGRLIFTDKEGAIAEYTAQVNNPEEYDADFIQALALRLAAYLAPRVTTGDQLRLGDRAFQLYQVLMAKACATAANEEQADQPAASDLERARD